ncbi:hypothetical protein STEG23_011953, partial [Scotinomys teguina]
ICSGLLVPFHKISSPSYASKKREFRIIHSVFSLAEESRLSGYILAGPLPIH